MHLRERGNTAKIKWIWKLKSMGLRPHMETLEEVSRDRWQEAETYWITQLRALGHVLLNGDNGGLGNDRLPETIKRKIADSLRGRPNLALTKPVAQYTRDGVLVKVHQSFQDAAKSVGLRVHCNISRAVRLGTACYGFLWRRPHGI